MPPLERTRNPSNKTGGIKGIAPKEGREDDILDLDDTAFAQRQLPVVFLTHTRSSRFAGAKLQAVAAVFMSLDRVPHVARQDPLCLLVKVGRQFNRA